MAAKRSMPKIGKYSTDENICKGLMTPKGKIYSPSMMRGTRKRGKGK